MEEAKSLGPRAPNTWPNPCQSKGSNAILYEGFLKPRGGVGGGDGGAGGRGILRNQIQCLGPSQPALYLCSSGGRKGGRSHLASDDTPPGMPACVSRRRTLDLEDGRISCSDTMEGEPGPNTVTPAACHSVSTCTEGS